MVPMSNDWVVVVVVVIVVAITMGVFVTTGNSVCVVALQLNLQ